MFHGFSDIGTVSDVVVIESDPNGAEATDVAEEEEEEDVFQCGKCKCQFTSLVAFMEHKKKPCKNTSAIVPKQLIVTELDPNTVTADYQVTSIVLGDTEFLSLPTLDSLSQWEVPGTYLESSTGVPQSLALQLEVCSQSVTANVVTPCAEVDVVTTTNHDPARRFISTVVAKSERPVISAASTVADAKQNEKIVAKVGSRSRWRPQVTEKLKKLLKCEHCNKEFQKNFDLQQHLRSHTGERPFQCIVCGKGFSQKSNVKKHMVTHKVWPNGLSTTLPKQPVAFKVTNVQVVKPEQPPESEKQTEASAPAQMTSEESVPDVAVAPEEPQKLEITIDNSYICQYCSESFTTFWKFKSHLKIHKNQQVYRCVVPNCGETFPELPDFLSHTSTHENEMNYRCHVCSKQFATLYDLGVHKYTHTLQPNQMAKALPRFYRCTKCMSKFSTKEGLEHHLVTTSHNFGCPHCKKVFPCERYLRRHLPIHRSVDSHTCPICKKTFKTEQYVKVHLLVHSPEKKYVCSHGGCGSRFNRKDRLKRHALIHQPLKRFKCPFKSIMSCDREFTRADKLKAHIISHSGLRPHRCQKCPKSFSRRANLSEHLKTHKDGDLLKFLCEKCHKRFLSKEVLSEHVCLEQRPSSPALKAGKRRGRPRKRDPTAVMSESENSVLQTNSVVVPSGKVVDETVKGVTGVRRSNRARVPKKILDFEQKSLPAQLTIPECNVIEN